ncbi:hypothetical protein FLM48_06795 [Shewanella sp. Scap07]|uniref:hypothetical protein n=1 Tax=Shewanella sp. Scap07 TaxID=2589987 RepID=UPI0015B9CBE9|nr:hypothetical protein [Shewanella sp. Scap07]QLE84817.1 hypothetical protein FLM48_06795 [Shewanella sp. Scap07]
MKLETLFKLSVLLVCLSSFFMHYITGSLVYSKDIVEAMSWHGFNSSLPHWLKLSIVAPLQLAALLMLTFNVIARNLFALLSLIGLCLCLFDGVAAYTHYEILILQIYYLASGVVLTLSFTSLAHRFKAKNNSQTLDSPTPHR